MPLAFIYILYIFIFLAAGRMIQAYTIMSGATTPEKRGWIL